MPFAFTPQRARTRLRIRQGAPDTTSPIAGYAEAGTVLFPLRRVEGQSVRGNAGWYELDGARYVWAGACVAAADFTTPDGVIDRLSLVGYADAGARSLAQQFPKLVFTSGRRSLQDQARAMAQNVVLERGWIASTYRESPMRAQLQAWIDAHPEADSQAELQVGLESVMQRWAPDQLKAFSSHLSGLAFDLQPLSAGPLAEAVKAAIRNLTGLEKFLEHEGGLVRWHLSFLAG